MPGYGFWNIARNYPDRVAIEQENGAEVTYGELRDQANRLVHALRGSGLRRGDGIVILQPNCLELLVAVLAAGQAGLFHTPLNHHLGPAEIAYVLENSEAKAFLAHEKFGATAVAAVAEAARPDLTCLAVGEIEGFRSYADLVGSQSPDEPADREAGSLLSYTSGTTGRPKGVRRPLTGLSPEQQDEVGSAFNMLALFGLDEGSGNAHLVVSPLYHNAPLGFAMFALQLGHKVILTEKFKPELMLDLVQRKRITSTHMVPIQFHRLLQLPEQVRGQYDVSSMKVIAHAGAPCPPDVKKSLIDWFGPVVYEYYSCSEGVGGTMVTPEEALARPGTVGRPYRPGAVIRILDDDGKELPPGEVGLVYTTVVGVTGFQYFKDDEKTAAARHGELFTAGDFGRLDDDGYLYLVSRRTDLILSGGVNIYPAEIESVLFEHPWVADVAVFGIPNPEWGEEIKAVVQLTPGAAEIPATVDELLGHCKQRLASFKVPRSMDFTVEMPRDPNGKLFKRKLRDPYWAETNTR